MFNFEGQIESLVQQMFEFTKAANDNEEYLNTAINLRNSLLEEIALAGFPEEMHKGILLMLMNKIKSSGDMETQVLFVNKMISSGLVKEVVRSAKIIYDKLSQSTFICRPGKDVDEELILEIESVLGIYQS